MNRLAWTFIAAATLLPTVSHAQTGISVDTVTIVESSQIMYDGQLVDYFRLHTNDNDLRFIEDSAYIKLIGFIKGPDTSDLPDAVVWMKTNNPTVGDSWEGMIPTDSILATQEMIAGTKQVTVGAGTIWVYQVDVWTLDGTYVGEKWWSDGIGLVGWSFAFCNETTDLELLGYNFAPGSDFWPHTVGDQYIIESRDDYTIFDADHATLNVDGNGADWAAITPAVQDDSGDDTTGYDGCDIKDLHVAADDTYLYLMMNFWDGPPDSTWAALYTPGYAFIFNDDKLGNYWGYAIGYEPSPVSSWYIAGVNLDATGADVACGNVIEARIPLANLGFFSSELPSFYAVVDSGHYDISCYNTVHLPGYCPIAVSGDANGDFEVKTSDIVYLVNYVLKAGAAPLPCPAAGDANGDGEVKSSDIIYLVNYVLKGGPYPADICALIPGVWSCP